MKIGDMVSTKHQMKYKENPDIGIVTSLQCPHHFVEDRDAFITVMWLDDYIESYEPPRRLEVISSCE